MATSCTLHPRPVVQCQDWHPSKEHSPEPPPQRPQAPRASEQPSPETRQLSQQRLTRYLARLRYLLSAQLGCVKLHPLTICVDGPTTARNHVERLALDLLWAKRRTWKSLTWNITNYQRTISEFLHYHPLSTMAGAEFHSLSV